MQDDSEAIQKSFLKLLQDLALTETTPSVERSNSKTSFGSDDVEDLPLNYLDLLDSEEVSISSSGQAELQSLSFMGEQPLTPGEGPAVQDRFHALLKRRLQTEIQRHPPLFPWETEITDYESETAGLVYATSGTTASNQPVPAIVTPAEPGVAPRLDERIPVWAAQLKNLNLPVSMPDDVLAHLLERCQEVMQSSLREGAKLVQAVESLFPGHTQSLNHLAGLVMVSPARSGIQNPAKLSSQESDFPSSYEAAVPAQQMVLSLLAAREILNSLTLTISPSRPQTERQWLTAAGMLTLKTEYDVQQDHVHLQVRGELPCGGRLSFRAGETQSTAQRSDSGRLSVELFDLQPDQTYPLEVQFYAPDQNPLIFAVRPASD